MTQWTITIDNIAEPNAPAATNANAVGIVGPRGAPLTHEQIKTDPRAVQFRMLDDDGEVYYIGYMVGDENEFAPLDDFGMPNAGATTIQLLTDGVWQTL